LANAIFTASVTLSIVNTLKRRLLTFMSVSSLFQKANTFLAGFSRSLYKSSKTKIRLYGI
jgi:hypothetical protein